MKKIWPEHPTWGHWRARSFRVWDKEEEKEVEIEKAKSASPPQPPKKLQQGNAGKRSVEMGILDLATGRSFGEATVSVFYFLAELSK